MSQSYRLRITRNALKLRVATRIPAQLVGVNFITITKASGVYTFDVDYSLLGPGPISDPATAYIAISDTTAGIYRTVTLASLLTSGLDADLQAIAALTGTGILARTADDTWALRTLTAPAAGITITNPAGVAGNPTLVLANDLAAVEGLSSNGMATRTATDTWTVRTITAGALLGVNDGDGVAGNPTIAVTDAEILALGGLTSAADRLPYFTGSGTASLATFTAFARTLVDDADATAGRVTLGVVIGTDVQAFDSDLAALAANSTDGLWAHTGAGTGAARTLTAPAAGITVTNPAGIAGDPTLVLANDLLALEGLASTGIARRTGSDAWSVGTAVSNAELATMAAYTIKANATGSSAVPTDVSIPALTQKVSPVSADKIMIADSAASDALKYATVSSIAAAGSVASLNGQTGALAFITPPQGRLTLQTVTAVMSTTQSAKTTIYYTPYVGNQIPIYDGTNMVHTAFAELSVATTDATKSPAAIGASKVNDWFVWNDGGTIRVGHGPDWTTDIARSAGTALVLVNGIYLNNASITNGPAASRGTYVGTTRSNSSSQLDWIYGASAAGGTAALLNVWNMYNRVNVTTTVTDSNASWNTATSATPAALDTGGAGSGLNNRISAVSGIPEDGVRIALFGSLAPAAAASAFGDIGFGLDVTNAFDKRARGQSTSGGVTVLHVGACELAYAPQTGFHFWQALQAGDGTNVTGIAGGDRMGFSGAFRM